MAYADILCNMTDVITLLFILSDTLADVLIIVSHIHPDIIIVTISDQGCLARSAFLHRGADGVVYTSYLATCPFDKNKNST